MSSEGSLFLGFFLLNVAGVRWEEWGDGVGRVLPEGSRSLQALVLKAYYFNSQSFHREQAAPTATATGPVCLLIMTTHDSESQIGHFFGHCVLRHSSQHDLHQAAFQEGTLMSFII